MTQKSFDIIGKKTAPATTAASEMERFISGSEALTTMTVQVPERLRRALKQQALDHNTTVKELLTQILEAHFAQSP